MTMHVIHTEDGPVMDFSAEVDAGTRWLNQQDPRWFDKINLDELNLASGRQCVLGQLAMSTFREKVGAHVFNGYDAVITAFNANDGWTIGHGFAIDGDQVGRALGFDREICTCGCDSEGLIPHAWESLTRQWVDQIEGLRLSGEAADAAAEAPAAIEEVARQAVNAA